MFTYVQHVAKEVGARLYTNTSAILGKCFSLAVKPELGKKTDLGREHFTTANKKLPNSNTMSPGTPFFQNLSQSRQSQVIPATSFGTSV